MSTDHYRPEFVETFPRPLEPGVLYVSARFSMANHLYPCGCGCEVPTRLAPAKWRLTFDGEVSLAPSIAATALPCNSHYLITRGAVDWHYALTPAQTQRAREADRRAVQYQRAATARGSRRLSATSTTTPTHHTEKGHAMSDSTCNNGKQWSDADKRNLDKLADKNSPTRVIGLKLGRSEDAVRSQAQRQGTSLKPTNQSPYNRRGK